MDKKEWIKHCKWLDTFRGKNVEKDMEKFSKEKPKKKKKKNS